jgi:NADH-quinone oxidoreductase subunit N
LSVFDVGLVWLVVVGLLNSALAAYYYLKIVHAMYLKPPPTDKALTGDPPVAATAGVMVALVVVAGLVPAPLIQAATDAANVLFH